MLFRNEKLEEERGFSVSRDFIPSAERLLPSTICSWHRDLTEREDSCKKLFTLLETAHMFSVTDSSLEQAYKKGQTYILTSSY